MGVVYLVQHEVVGRYAAMKVITNSADLRAERGAMQRFRLEAELLFQLKLPNVPDFYDAELLPSGTSVLILEYLDGYDLAETLHRLEKLEVGDALFVVCETLRPLTILHTKSVHRDIK